MLFRSTFEDKDDYVIIEEKRKNIIKSNSNLKQSGLTDRYSSDRVELITKDELKNILIKEKLMPIKN